MQPLVSGKCKRSALEKSLFLKKDSFWVLAVAKQLAYVFWFVLFLQKIGGAVFC